jgi:hypothetical protein
MEVRREVILLNSIQFSKARGIVPLFAALALSGCAADATGAPPGEGENVGDQSEAYKVNPPDTALGYHGGTGGQDYWPSCGAGNVAIGIYGTAGNPGFIDQIGLECATVNENGTLTWLGLSQEVGGSAGYWYEMRCPANQALVGFAGNSHTYLDYIAGIACAPLSNLTGWYPWNDRRYWPPVWTTNDGNGGDWFGADTCPVNYAITYMHVRAGNWIDAVQAHCQYINPNQ